MGDVHGCFAHGVSASFNRWSYVVSHGGGQIGATDGVTVSVQQVELRPYQTPRLYVYGSMKALTASGSGPVREQSHPRKPYKCTGPPFRGPCRP